MPRLPRGKCRTCGREVALRKGNVAREHKYPSWVSGGVTHQRLGTCAGSGKRVRVVLTTTRTADWETP